MRARAAALAFALAVAACGGEVRRDAPGEPLADELAPLGRWTRGDPIALALAPDGERLWRVDGARASAWRVDGARLEELRAFDVVGPVFALFEHDQRLLLACGERGLVAFDLRDDTPEPRVLWREPGRWCTDLEARDGVLWSTFAALDDSRLVALDATTFAHAASFELETGTAWAVAARGRRAWVALGAGGLARAELGEHVALPGPDLPDAEWGTVRDVALAEDVLVAACDGLGLLTIALDAPWGPTAEFEGLPLELEGRPTYAARVAADGARIAVGTNLAPVAAQEGAPYGLVGRIDARLRVGEIDPASYTAGRGEGWFSFERADGAWVERARATGRGGWRSLVLAGDTSFEQHLGTGLVVRRASDGVELVRDAPEGLAVVSGTLALDDPDLLLVGNDSAGSRPGGWPRLANARIDVPDDARGLEPLGLLAGPQWRDGAGRAWCLFGTPVAWSLWQVDAAHPKASRHWPVPAVPDGEGESGSGYFSGALVGDTLVLSRARSREGLALASARELVEQALATPAGEPLTLRVHGTVRTHADAGLDACFTWEPALDAARGLAVAPCGFGADGRARWLVVDVAAEPPRVVSELSGELDAGHAVACALDGVRLVAVDLMGDVLAFDLADPARPRRTGRWSAPPDAFDALAPNLLDVELVPAVDGTTRAWIAAGRAGLVHLTLDAAGALAFERRLPSDGWVACVRLAPGERLLVGDQKGGARLYAR